MSRDTKEHEAGCGLKCNDAHRHPQSVHSEATPGSESAVSTIALAAYLPSLLSILEKPPVTIFIIHSLGKRV
jgi:hypothetical protein